MATSKTPKSEVKIITSEHKYARVSASKVRLVAKVVSRLDAEEALVKLQHMAQKGAMLLAKVLTTAMANAEHNFGLKKEDLHIKSIMIGEGPTLKRFRPRSRGMANRINKRTAHIKVTLSVIEHKAVEKKSNRKEEKQPETKPKEATKKVNEKIVEKEITAKADNINKENK